MNVRTERLYSSRATLAIHIVCTVLVYAVALLVYPMLFVVLGLVTLIWFGAYEVVGAALLLDALLAPGGSALGEYHYTVLFLVASAATAHVRRTLFTSS